MILKPHPLTLPEKWRTLKHGLLGIDVAAWQTTLLALGYQVIDSLGDFDDSTHNATLSFQRLRGLDIDGIVGPLSKGAINQKLVIDRDSALNIEEFSDCLDNIAFVQAKHYRPAEREEIKWVVLHSMEGAEASTKAETVARWFADKNPRFPAPRASAHFAIDSDSIVAMVKEKDVAWGASGANKFGIHLEHAGKARQTKAQWMDGFSEPMLMQSAWLTAQLCMNWDLPIEFITRDNLDKGEKGITTHNEVTRSNLSDRGTHTDPGKNFPMDWYLNRVSEAALLLRS